MEDQNRYTDAELLAADERAGAERRNFVADALLVSIERRGLND